MILLRRLAALLLTLAAALFGSMAAGAAAPHVEPGIGHYSYNTHHAPTDLTNATTQRGPPPSSDHRATYDAVHHWSNGASVRPDEPTTLAATTCTVGPEFVDAARAATVTGGQVEVGGGDLSVFPDSMVAAKNAPTVTFSRSRAPGIAQNFDNAVANGGSAARSGDRLGHAA